MRRWGIPRAHVDAFLESMRMDITETGYRTYADLEHYMYGSAAVIGLQMLPILEPLTPEAAPAGAGPGRGVPAEQLHPRRRRGPQAGPGVPAAGGPRAVRRDHRRPGRRRGDAAGAAAAAVRDRADPGAVRLRRAGHRHARPDLPGLHAHRLRAVRRDPRRGRAGRLPGAHAAGVRVDAAPAGRRRPGAGAGLPGPVGGRGAGAGRRRRTARTAPAAPGRRTWTGRGSEPQRLRATPDLGLAPGQQGVDRAPLASVSSGV